MSVAGRETREGSSVKGGLLGVLGVLAVVVVIVVAVSSRGGSGSGDDPAAVGGDPGATVRTAAVDGGVTDTGAALHDWWVGGGQDHLTTVSRDATSVGDDASAGDLVSMGNDCTTLLTDVQAAQVYDPIPDPVTHTHWSKALDHFAQAAADCADGTTDSDDALIARSKKEMRAGNAELSVTTDRVNSLSGDV